MALGDFRRENAGRLRIPPIGEVVINFRWQSFIVESGTQATHAFFLLVFAVVNLEVRFPPEIFVVERVVVVEENQVVSQRFRVFKFCRVNERMRWR